MKVFLIFVSLQALALLADEFFFHRRRFLPPWERWGHPADTLALVLPLIWSAWEGSGEWSPGFLILAAFSCLFVTKDEWVHARHCRAGEHWLHSLLFLLHPLVLLSAPTAAAQAPNLFRIVPVVMSAFALYQLIYWNFYADRTVQRR